MSIDKKVNFSTPFIIGEYEVGAIPKSCIDQMLTQISGTIRLKPNWQTKINDKTIVDKWLNEIRRFDNITDLQFQYVIDELRYLSKLGQGSIRISPVDGVWEADNLISTEMKKKLLLCVNKLENVPEFEKDWHPGSNHQVLDLVHPSLYPYINGITQITSEPIPLSLIINPTSNMHPSFLMKGFILKDGYVEKISSLAKNDREQNDYSLSKKYQWLPSEFKVDQNGHTTISSYINNLNPNQHMDLYNVLANIFESFLPLFAKTLTDLANYEDKTNRITVNDWYDGSHPDNMTDDEYDEYERTKPIHIPDITSFIQPKNKPLYDLKNRNLQVIVKLANIELTPENPKYPGGSWHVEGMKNEDIVASGIYYYYSENITESHLHFREAIREPNYEQNDNRGVDIVYGLKDEGPLNQDLGYVITQADRCISFPNIYQHKVEPFTLIDPSKPGHRKILVFFLVDPNKRILSTANVPPQQISWLGQGITLDEAHKYREDLMKERKFFIANNNEELFERPFSLCEH